MWAVAWEPRDGGCFLGGREGSRGVGDGDRKTYVRVHGVLGTAAPSMNGQGDDL